jgi:D-alanyl-D-alanine carboxypeptidase
MDNKTGILQRIIDESVDNKKVFGASFCLKYKNDLWCGAGGNLNQSSQYFIASTTKLFVTAIILNLKSKGVLDIDDKISRYLSEEILMGLHILKGNDYSKELTIKNLLAHTSGIPGYFQEKDKEGISLESEIIKGNDLSWTFEKKLEYSKRLNPLFVPGSRGKAHYSDTNFQLLGKIIENLTNKSFAENCDQLICQPIGLVKTYMYNDINDRAPKNLYFKNIELHIPEAMASFGPDGGIVSTSGELILFLEAFFDGSFFPKLWIDSLKEWNGIFFPMQAGIGIHRFKLPWIINPTGAIPELIGHSGLSGALAYYSPEKELYVTGTVNQIAYPDTSFKLAIKLIRETLKNIK